MAEANLAVIITGRGKDLINEFQKIGKSAESSGSKTASGWHKASTAVKVAGTAIAGTAIAVAGASIHMADAYEKSHARLGVALKNTGSSWKQQGVLVRALTDDSVKYGYTATDIEGALAIMTTGMGSSQKAMDNMGLAQDLAAAKGMDLATAAGLVTKASEGQIKPLKALGIDLPVAAGGALKVKKAQDGLAASMKALSVVQTKVHMGLIKGPAAVFAMKNAQDKLKASQDKLSSTQQTGDQILTALSNKLGGCASAQAKTFEGRTKAMKAELGNLGIKIGMALMPILMKLMDIIQHLVTWFGKHKTVAKALAVVVGTVLVVAVLAYAASMASAAAATIAATWPILAIIAAVVAVVAGIVLLWTHWNQIWNWISHHKAYAILIAAIFPILVPIFAIIGAIKWIAAHWSTIWSDAKNAVQGFWSVVQPILQPIIDQLNRVADAAERVGHAVGGLKSLAGSITGLGPTVVGVNTTGTVFGNTFGGAALGGSGIAPGPHGHAFGGAARRYKSYIVGERGPELLQMGTESGFVQPNRGGGQTVVQINMPQGFMFGTPQQFQRLVVDAQIQYERKNGKRHVNVVNPV